MSARVVKVVVAGKKSLAGVAPGPALMLSNGPRAVPSPKTARVVSAISTRRTHRFSSLNLAGWSTGPFQPAIFLDHFVTGTPCRQAGASPAPSINSAGGLEMSGSPATFSG